MNKEIFFFKSSDTTPTALTTLFFREYILSQTVTSTALEGLTNDKEDHIVACCVVHKTLDCGPYCT